LHAKKRITINGKDYEENPEKRFALTVLDAVAEFERAKSTERTMRGRMHRLRSGVLASNGATIYGYKRTFLRDYVERIVFDRGSITILGSLQLDGATPRTLPFRIEGEIAKGSERRGRTTSDLVRGYLSPNTKSVRFRSEPAVRSTPYSRFVPRADSCAAASYVSLVALLTQAVEVSISVEAKWRAAQRSRCKQPLV
jgi:hypothetical protein